MQLTRQQKLILGVALAGVLFFMLGLALTVLHILDGKPSTDAPGISGMAHGKPRVEDAVRTPTEEDDPPEPTPTSRPARAASPEQSVAWVIQDGAKAHDRPTTTGPAMATLRYGDKVRPMERRQGFDRVLLPDGRPAWISSNLLSNQRPADLAEKGPGDAVKTVDAFYQNISGKRFSAAYDLLSFEWKRALDFTTFARGYADTENADCQVTRCTPIDRDHVKVDLQVRVAEKQRRFQQVGSYLLVREKGDWKLDSGDLRDLPNAETRSTPDEDSE